MSITGPVFRVFISSTFSDFRLERRALHEDVFPRVQAHCRERGARFQPIDLRWGISREASHDQRTAAICLDEVRRCHRVSPDFFFIALLGDRYGSALLPDSIPADDFSIMLGALDAHDRGQLRAWYRLDDNALPNGVWLLRPRSGPRAIDVDRYLDAKEWESQQQALLALLTRACQHPAVMSPTRSSILASLTEREMEVGIFAADGDAYALCFLRSIAHAPDEARVPPYFAATAAARDRQEALKARVLARVPDGIVRFSARYEQGDLSDEHLASFGALALEHIVRQVDRALEAHREAESAADRAHRRFADERLRHFTGRDQPVAQIVDYLAGTHPTPLLVTGPSGVGKTSVMLQAEMLQAEREATRIQGRAATLRYFVGGSSPISDLSTLLRDLYQRLASTYGAAGLEIPARREELIARLADFLALATAAQPLVVFLDAIDQLRDAQDDLAWMPGTLPLHVHLVASVLPGPALGSWIAAHPGVGLIDLRPLPSADAEHVLAGLLSDAGRTLQPEQHALVLAHCAEVGLPLYWRLAFEEARRWRSWQVGEELPTLPADPTGVIAALFDRLESSVEHGPDLVTHALGLIGAARDGLAEHELLAVLNRDAALVARITGRSSHSPRVSHVPVVVWAMLAQDLDPYLTEYEADDTTLMTFYHRQVRDAAAVRYLRDPKGIARHLELARYFEDGGVEPLLLGPDRPNARKLAELPAHQASAGLTDELAGTLTDASFLEQKIRRFGLDALLDDYALAPVDDGDLQRIADALRGGTVVLALALGEVWNQVQGRAGLGRVMHASLLRPTPRFDLTSVSLLPAEMLVRVFQGHTGRVNHCAFSPDGQQALSASEDGTLRLWSVRSGLCLRVFTGHTGSVTSCAFSPDGQRVLSGSKDQTLRLWEIDTGEIIRVYTGHPAGVANCVFTPDGQAVVSNSSSIISTGCELAIWDMESGRALRVYRGNLLLNRYHVSRFALSPDGEHVVSDSHSRGLRIWRLCDGKWVRSLKWKFPERGWRGWLSRRTAIVTDCSFSIDRRMVIASAIAGPEEGRIQIWNALTGMPVRLIRSNAGSIHSCALSPDGQYVVGGCEDSTLRLWDAATGEQVGVLQGHSERVNSCVFRPDGRFILSASADQTMRIWRVGGFPTRRSIARHSKGVGGCAISPDGHMGLSTSFDGTAIVWDMASSAAIQTQNVASDFCRCAFSPDGQYALYGTGEHSMALWDVKRRREVRTFSRHRKEITCCVFHPRASQVLSASWDKTIRLWDINSGKVIRSYEGHVDAVHSCAFSPDGERIVSASRDGTLRIWDTSSATCLRVLQGHRQVVWHGTFSPDMLYVLSASRDRTLRLWDASTGQTVHTFDEQGGDVRDCLFTPDGSRFFSTSDDGTLRYWDSDSRRELMRWTTDSGLRTCELHPGSSRLMVGDDLGGIHFLHLVP